MNSETPPAIAATTTNDTSTTPGMTRLEPVAAMTSRIDVVPPESATVAPGSSAAWAAVWVNLTNRHRPNDRTALIHFVILRIVPRSFL